MNNELRYFVFSILEINKGEPIIKYYGSYNSYSAAQHFQSLLINMYDNIYVEILDNENNYFEYKDNYYKINKNLKQNISNDKSISQVNDILRDDELDISI